ncbi:hypothetical protein D0466_09520 [Peribacillus glennii]|uniref:Uncharacterized protein n=1 Tax=Peribacillus glennii TaxID=2303991 RepID=A0A372LCH0_9BACI|nr:hypothetical protein D0466_09520 [Peribacillus glennii]
MTRITENVNAYKFLTPLLISGFFFFLSFYLRILNVYIYVFTLPFYALFLFISLYLFYQTDKKMKNHGEKNWSRYSFYHNCVGIYFVLSVVLFFVSVFYIPFYNDGGQLFIWYCAPMSLLCLMSLINSRKRLKDNTIDPPAKTGT